MISPSNVADAVEALLLARWPENAVYRDLVPEDFDRPSCAIECVGFSAAQASIDAISVDFQMLVRVFEAVDDYHMTDFDALWKRAMTVLGLFARGWIEVSDSDTGERRCPKITALAAPVVGADYAEIRFTASMQLRKEDFEAAPAAAKPLMQRVSISGTNEQEVEAI